MYQSFLPLIFSSVSDTNDVVARSSSTCSQDTRGILQEIVAKDGKPIYNNPRNLLMVTAVDLLAVYPSDEDAHGEMKAAVKVVVESDSRWRLEKIK